MDKRQGRNFPEARLIIYTMRVLLVILMMALLPLRAGLGDVMAMESVGSHAHAERHPAAAHDCHEAQRHPGANGMDHHTPLPISTDTTQADPTCSDCSVCHAAALPGMRLPQLPPPVGSAPPQARVTPHVSADPVLGLKPPIT